MQEVLLSELFDKSRFSGLIYVPEVSGHITVSHVTPTKDGYYINTRLAAMIGDIIIDRIKMLIETAEGKKIINANEIIRSQVEKRIGLKHKLTFEDLAEGLDRKRTTAQELGIDIIFKDATLMIEELKVQSGRRTKKVKVNTLMLYNTAKRKSSILVVEPWKDPQAIWPMSLQTDRGTVEVNNLAEVFMYLTRVMPENGKVSREYAYEALLTSVRYARMLMPLTHVLLYAPPGTGKSYAYRFIAHVAGKISGTTLSPASAILDARFNPPKQGVFATYKRIFIDEFGKFIKRLSATEVQEFTASLLSWLADGILERRGHKIINRASTLRVGIYDEVQNALSREEARKSIYEQIIDRMSLIAHINAKKVPKTYTWFKHDKTISIVWFKKLIRTYQLSNLELIKQLVSDATGAFASYISSRRAQAALERFAHALARFWNVSASKAIDSIKAMLDVMRDTYNMYANEIIINDSYVYEIFYDTLLSDLYERM